MGNSWIFATKKEVKDCTLGKADGLEICKSIHFWCMIQLTTDCFCILHAKVCWDKREGGGMKAKTNWCCRKNVHKAPGSAEECSKHDWLQSCFAKKVEHRLICFCRAERNVSSLKICQYHPPLPSFNFGFDLPYLQILLIYDMDNGYIHHLPSRRSILVFLFLTKKSKVQSLPKSA